MIGAFVQVNTGSRKAKGEPVGYVLDENGCWLWAGHCHRLGYGVIRNPATSRLESAHRFMYEREHGSVPKELDLDHLCRNRSCVNPTHLQPVTHRENCLRGLGPCSANSVKTHCKNGHELTPSNLVLFDLSLGRRRCRVCKTNYDASYAAKRRARCN